MLLLISMVRGFFFLHHHHHHRRRRRRFASVEKLCRVNFPQPPIAHRTAAVAENKPKCGHGGMRIRQDEGEASSSEVRNSQKRRKMRRLNGKLECIKTFFIPEFRCGCVLKQSLLGFYHPTMMCSVVVVVVRRSTTVAKVSFRVLSILLFLPIRRNRLECVVSGSLFLSYFENVFNFFSNIIDKTFFYSFQLFYFVSELLNNVFIWRGFFDMHTELFYRLPFMSSLTRPFNFI